MKKWVKPKAQSSELYTSNTLSSNNENMKKIHLTLTGLTLSGVLKTLLENNLGITYIGTDQNFNVIYEISYGDEKEEIISGILKRIGDFEDFENEFGQAIEQVFVQYALSVRQKSEIKKAIGFSFLNSLKQFGKKYNHYENGKH